MKIYLDVCCLNRPFDDQRDDRIRLESEAVLIILERCLSEWVMISSEVINYEISKIPDGERREKVGILASLAKEKVILEDKIIERAKEIEKLGIKAIDALHVACAEKSADVMLTTDDSLIKKVKENRGKIKVRVMNPVKFVEEVLRIE